MQRNSDDTIADPIKLIEEDHAWQLLLCDALEKIADSLPNNIDKRLIATTGEALRKVVPLHNRMEEKALFPILAKRAGQTKEISDTFLLLCREHETDEAFACEIADELDQFICRGAQKNPEMMGYMLRGLFVSLRRHINWENQTVLPLARNILKLDDREELREWMRTHPEVLRCRRLLKNVGTCLGYQTCPYL